MSKILIIDDEPEENDRVRRALEERDFEVTFCSNALKGLEMLKATGGWSAVVLDMTMPVPLEWQTEVKGQVTGLKILAEARDVLIKHNIPVLVFTNRSTEMLKQQIDALDFPPHLLARLEKDVLMPREFAFRVFEIAGAAQRGVSQGPGSWMP